VLKPPKDDRHRDAPVSGGAAPWFWNKAFVNRAAFANGGGEHVRTDDRAIERRAGALKENDVG
jgi:hypothetical protein